MTPRRPRGWHTVTPRIIVDDPAGLVRFLKRTFAATGNVRTDRPAEIRIGDSLVMISDGGGVRDPMPAFLYVYTPDADAAFKRAVRAGAVVVEAPQTMDYGDRRATVKDPWGNLWQIATRLRR